MYKLHSDPWDRLDGRFFSFSFFVLALKDFGGTALMSEWNGTEFLP